MMRYQVCGIEVAAVTSARAAEILVEAAVARESLQVHLCNVYTLSLVDSDDRLRESLMASNLNLPDGAPIAWLGKRWGTAGPVRGPSLVGNVVDLGRDFRLRHFLYGGKAGVAGEMACALVQKFAGACIVAAEAPPFRDLLDGEVVELGARIVDRGADIVWIGLGTPRQDYLVARIAAVTGAVVVPVGAAFDFWSGSISEAPRWLHGSGFEWLYRLSQEPKRLWRRYSFSSARFIYSVSIHYIRRRVTRR